MAPIHLIMVAASRGRGDVLASGRIPAPGSGFYQQIYVSKLQNS